MAEQLEELERRLASLLDQALAGQRTAMLDRLRSGLGDLANAVEAAALAQPGPRPAASDFAPLADEGSAAGRSGGFLALRDGLARIDAARTQADLLATLLDVATELADRAVVLLARSEGLIGWANAGFGDGVEAVDGVILPYTGAWALVRHGTVELDAASANMLVVALGGATASDGVLVPIVLRERLAAVLYADRRSADHELAVAALQVLTYAATQALETLPLRVGYAPSLASALDREQEEPLAAWEEAAAEPVPTAPAELPAATPAAAALATFAAALVEEGPAAPAAAEEIAVATIEEEPVAAFVEVPAEEAIVEPTAAETLEPAEPDVSTWETGEQPVTPVEAEVPVAAEPEVTASELPGETGFAVTETAAITAIESAVEDAAIADSAREDLELEEPSVTAELATELPLAVEPEAGDELTAAPGFTTEAAEEEREEPEEAGFAVGLELEEEETEVSAVETEAPAWSLEPAPPTPPQEVAPVAAYAEAAWEAPTEPEAMLEAAAEEPLAERWAEASEIELAPADEPVVEEEIAAEAPTRMLPAFEAEPLAPEVTGEPEQGEDTLLTSRPRTSAPSLAAPPLAEAPVAPPAPEESPNATMMWSVPVTPDFEPELAAPVPPPEPEPVPEPPAEAPPPLPPAADQPAAVAPPPPEAAEAAEAAPRPETAAVASPPPGRGGDTVEVRPPEDLTGPGWAFATTRIQTMGRDPAHEEARRLARLLVSEIKLYNEELVEEGRRMRNIYGLLREDIDRSRQMFEERIDAKVRAESDYFQQELVRILAAGDAGALGS